MTLGDNMTLVALESCTTVTRMVAAIPSDPTAIPFVAKVQKARTRKNKKYFLLQATIPKEVYEKIGAKAGDYLFFRAKKAEWYHMLDWNAVGKASQMLPGEIRNRLIIDGLYGQGLMCQLNALAATNLAPSLQMLGIQSNLIGEQ